MHVTPADWVVRQFGGTRTLARIINRGHSSIHRWRKRATTHVPGCIPADCMPMILDAAAARGLDVQPLDLIKGRDVEGA
jgi:hypothetical protein